MSRASLDAPSICSPAASAPGARCESKATSTGARSAQARVLHSSALSPGPAQSSAIDATWAPGFFWKRLPITPLGLGRGGAGLGAGGAAAGIAGALEELPRARWEPLGHPPRSAWA
eukprot:scaffold494_cov117-Isochrysis_galbana.AAC.5